MSSRPTPGRLDVVDAGYTKLLQPPTSPSGKSMRRIPSASSEVSAESEALARGGNLRFPLEAHELKQANDIVDRMRDGEPVQTILDEMSQQRWISPPKLGGRIGESPSRGRLTALCTDLELDDVMAVSQLYQWKLEQGETVLPLIIWLVDFREKEFGKIFEKKELMAALIGVQDVFILSREGDNENTASWDGSVHPRTPEIVSNRDQTIEKICTHIEEFVEQGGNTIDLFLAAPGHGNIGAIVNKLRDHSLWPMVATSGEYVQWKVTAYTGSFNMRGMQDSDLEAIGELVSVDNPLVDISRFPFFGGDQAHRNTSGLGVFCLPSLAREMMSSDRLLCASVRVFHDEFNQSLIEPDNWRLFKDGVSKLNESQLTLWQKICAEYEQSKDIKKYATALLNEALFGHVSSYKQGCVVAFAHDSCEAPLCDQLLFLYAWLVKVKPSSLTKPAVGRWNVDRITGFTHVDAADSSGVQAVQPALANCRDKGLLEDLRKVSQAYFLRHLDSICRGRKLPAEEGVRIDSSTLSSSAMSGVGVSELASCAQCLLQCESCHYFSCGEVSHEKGGLEDGSNYQEVDSTLNVWVGQVAGARPQVVNCDDDDDDRVPAQFDVVLPKICGQLLCEEKVRQLGDKMALRQKPVSMSSCAGPVLVQALWLRPAQVFAGAGMAALSYATAECPEKDLSYPLVIWIPYLVFMAIHLRTELRIFSHLSIPYLQTVGKWNVLGMEILGHERSFVSWLSIGLAISFLHLLGLGTANVFLGMVASEKINGICGQEEKLDCIWQYTLNQSAVFHNMGFAFYRLPLVVFGFQFLHLVIDMTLVLPGPNQWSTRGVNWRFSKGATPVYYPQPLERDVVEYIDPRTGGRSLLGLNRPHGTRFVYYNMFRYQLLTGAALDHLCQSSGMGLIAGMTNYLDTLARETNDTLPKTQDDAHKLSFEEVGEALKSTRKFLQDVCALLQIRILKVLFSGVLFSGMHLELQVTYFNLRCSADLLHCRDTPRLWIGIGTACLTSSLMIITIIMSARFAIAVRRVAQRCETFVVPVAEAIARELDESNNRGDDEAQGAQPPKHRRQEWLRGVIEQLEEGRRRCVLRLLMLFTVSIFLILNFVWAVTKMTMDQSFCPYHMWNVNLLNLQAGCVNHSCHSVSAANATHP